MQCLCSASAFHTVRSLALRSPSSGQERQKREREEKRAVEDSFRAPGPLGIA